MDLGEAPAPAPVAEILAQEYAAAQEGKTAPLYIDNPLTRAFSGLIAGRRLQQASSGAAAPAPGQAWPLLPVSWVQTLCQCEKCIVLHAPFWNSSMGPTSWTNFGAHFMLMCIKGGSCPESSKQVLTVCRM